MDEPLVRKAGLKIMGFVCESDALLDPMKDDIEWYTQLIIAGLQDQNEVVRIAACETVGDFSEHAVPDFLEQSEVVMPVLTKVLEGQIVFATQSEENSKSAARAVFALSEFIANMEDYDMKPYLQSSLKLCLTYLNDPKQHREIKYGVLQALSSIIIAADSIILPNRDELLKSFIDILKTDSIQD